jgi:hypothetical protein
MARSTRSWFCLTALAAALGLLAAPALAAPGNGPRVREVTAAAVHPWRLEIHRPPEPQPETFRGGQTAPLGLPLPGLPVATATQASTDVPAVPPETSERTFAELQALGVRNARVDLLWCQIEAQRPEGEGGPTSSAADWSVFDSVVASAERYGISLTPVVLCVPGWANGGAHYFTYPSDMGTFERFFALTLRRYPQIRAWEIWNEPNYEYFARPEPKVEPFVALLRAAHRARASTGSQAKLVSGGLAVSASVGMFDFFEQMAEAGALDVIDGLGVHPYSTLAPDQARSTFMRLLTLRQRLVARGRSDISLWLTEYGVPDATRRSGYGEAGDETRQAELLRRAYAIASRWPWVARLSWYEARDNCADPAEPECRLGLMRSDFAGKQAGSALHDLLAGGPFPRLASTTTARVLRTRPRGAGHSRDPSQGRVYRIRGTVFAPGNDVSGRRVVVRLRPLRARGRQSPPRTRTALLLAGAYSARLGRLRPGRYQVRVAFRGGVYHSSSTSVRVFRVPGHAAA